MKFFFLDDRSIARGCDAHWQLSKTPFERLRNLRENVYGIPAYDLAGFQDSIYKTVRARTRREELRDAVGISQIQSLTSGRSYRARIARKFAMHLTILLHYRQTKRRRHRRGLIDVAGGRAIKYI